MSHHLLKTGGCSVVIGPGHYGKFIPDKGNKLVKITKITNNHNEFKYLKEVRKIENYKDYYSIPDEDIYMLSPSHGLYQLVKQLVSSDLDIFAGMLHLQYMYIDYAGDKDLHDTLGDVIHLNDLSFWKSYKRIEQLARQILLGLNFLHERQLAHLDIKPENIMVNTIQCSFKLIDFGFCVKYPFDDFVKSPRGTPGYFPKYNTLVNVSNYLPKVNANDFIRDEHNKSPYMKDISFIYKIDSYCLGRVLYFLKYVYDEKKVYYCYNGEFHRGEWLDGIIEVLREDNVFKRITIKECLEIYF